MFNFFKKKKQNPHIEEEKKVQKFPELEVKKNFDLSTPESCVKEFIEFYEEWNNWAISLPESAMSESEIIAKTYEKIITAICHSSVVPQGVSFGDDCMHTKENENIIKVETSDQGSIVFTIQKDSFNFISEYEYHLLEEDGKWRIKSLKYVSEDGKYESL